MSASRQQAIFDSAGIGPSGAGVAAPALGQLVIPAIGAMPYDLVLAMDGLYSPAGLVATPAPEREQESSEYGACRLELAGRAVVFRVAKTTPTKVGQFVTIWKRPTPSDEIAPLDSGDGVDVVIVSVADANYRGQLLSG